MAEPIVLPLNDFERLTLFFPIKVVNGFVTCDFQLGCYACHFCLNRRYPDWQRMLETRRIYRNSMQVDQAADLLKKVRALTEARVTLKFGHDTDMSLEEAEAQALFQLMPVDQPIAFMRRGKLLPKYKEFYMHPWPNLMVELTLTPRSRQLRYHTDPFKVLKSFEGVQANVFYTVGPICEDNFEEAKAILRAIPPGKMVWVRELISKNIPGYSVEDVKKYRGDELRAYAGEIGHPVVHYINCVVRSGVGLGFHKRGEFVSEPNPWQLHFCEVCPAKEVCQVEITEEDALHRMETALADLNLTLAQPIRKFGHKSYEIFVNEEVNFGDECYLREKTTLKIDLYKVGRKTGTSLSPDIATRWKASQFFPVDEVLQLARESYQLAFSEH